MIVSHASFGIDEDGASFGARAVLTTDYALKAHYERFATRISGRFERMTRQLKPPYRSALLPIILAPEDVLELLSS
jgi:hypothetical protein